MAGAPADIEPKRNRLAFWFLLPASAILLAVLAYPIVKMVVLSLQEAKLKNITRGTESWNNFENYTKLFSDPFFWTVVWRTIVFTAVCVGATMILGTLVALLLNKLGSKMRLTVLVGLLLAWATPAVTATQTWQFLFDTEFGVVNWALVSLGFEQFEGYSWLAQPLSLLSLAALIVVWAAIPFVALTLFAGLTQVPNEIYEAASLDGAGRWTQFWRLTVPQLAPIFLILFALSTIWDFRVFTQIYILQKSGGIARETDLLALYAYRTSFSGQQLRGGRGHRRRHGADAAGLLRHLHPAHDQADRRGIMINKKGGFVANTLAIILTVFMVFPVYWMVISSFKPRADFFLPTPKFLPIPATLDNYYRVINDKDFFNYARNSLIVTVVVVILSMLVAFLAATAVARFNFKGRKAYIVMLLAVQMVPVRGAAHLDVRAAQRGRAGQPAHRCDGRLPGLRPAVHDLDAARVHRQRAQGPRGGGDDRRLQPGAGVPQDPVPADRPGPGVHVGVRVRHGVERVHPGQRDPAGPEEADAAGLADVLPGRAEGDRLGGLMAGSVLFAMPVIIFFVIVQGRIQRGALEGGVKG